MPSLDDTKERARELLLDPDQGFFDKIVQLEILVRTLEESDQRRLLGELFLELLDEKYGDIRNEATGVIYETIHIRLLPLKAAPNN